MNTRYELNMDVPPREAIRLMYVSKSRFGGDWNSVPHTHSCTEVFYCVDGRGQFNVEGKMLDVAPDDMVIVNPRTLHTELSYQACPLEYIVLGIEGVEILFNQRDQGYTMVKCGAMREDMLGLTKMLLREIDAREDGCEMVCQDLTEVLLVKLVRTASLSLRVSTPPAESKECAAAKRYIDENYSRTITLDSLAEIAHVNKYYLSHSFKREYGTSPIDYLMKRRIHQQADILRDRGIPQQASLGQQVGRHIGDGVLLHMVDAVLVVEQQQQQAPIGTAQAFGHGGQPVQAFTAQQQVAQRLFPGHRGHALHGVLHLGGLLRLAAPRPQLGAGLLQNGQDLRFIAGLQDIMPDAKLHGLAGILIIAVVGQHYKHRVAVLLLRGADKGKAVQLDLLIVNDQQLLHAGPPPLRPAGGEVFSQSFRRFRCCRS